MFFKRKQQEEIPQEVEIPETQILLVLQFTTAAVFVYISEARDTDGDMIYMEDSLVDITGPDGTFIELDSTMTKLIVADVHQIDATLDKFKLDTLKMPVIRVDFLRKPLTDNEIDAPKL